MAYADFITAMMALFMVLWILGSEQELLEQFQEYFRNPPSPFMSQAGKFPVEIGEYSGHSGQDLEHAFFERVDPSVLQSIVKEFYRILNMEAEGDLVPPIEITITSDGLRLVVFDRQDSPLFEGATAELSAWGHFLMQNLSWLLSRYNFRVVIESHSGERDAAIATTWADNYGPWELSMDRSNQIRRQLEFYSAETVEIQRITGFGDTQPIDGDTGSGRTHQRVTLSLSLASPQAVHSATERF